MHTVLSDMDSKIYKDLNTVEIICDYWKERGWLDKYGKRFLEWLLEFIVYSIRSKKVKHPKNLYTRLSNLINKYGLDQYMNELSAHHRYLTKNL